MKKYCKMVSVSVDNWWVNMNLCRTVFQNIVRQIQPLANILSYVFLKTWNSFFWTGVKILIDSKAQLTLLGTEMDYQTDKLASEFIFNNPNIKGTCGCGESFNVWPIYWDFLWYGLWVWIFLSVLNVIICTCQTGVIRRGKWILSVNRLMGDWMLQVNKCWLWCFVMQMIGFWMSLIFLFWSLFYFYHYVLFNGTWWFVMVKMILNNVVNTAVCFVNWYIYIY